MAVEQQKAMRKEHDAQTEEREAREKGASPPVNHRIRDLESFNAVTGETREIAGLYFYDVLGNPLIDIALEVSRDFFRRPQIFTESGDPPVAPLLATLGARLGSEENFPSREQRAAIFSPLFGEYDDGNSEADFPRLRDELIQAAAAFAERSFDTGVGMLRERVRETHRPFKEYLVGLQGASTSWSRNDALPTVTEARAFPILRSKAVSSAYGIPIPPRTTWPYAEDSNGDKLVEEISKRSAWTDGATPALTREVFLNRQRAALRGAEALATIIDFDEGGSDEELDLLITKVYSWGAALLPGHRANQNGGQPASAVPSAMTPPGTAPVSR
jgi:hypothetical protein